MEHIRKWLTTERQYQPIDQEQDANEPSESSASHGRPSKEKEGFSPVEYGIFLLLGLAMLWAWNMFLAAAPYFQFRFASHEWMLTHFQSAEISVASVTNLISMLLLTKWQERASYIFRIALALCIYISLSLLLTFSTWVAASAPVYFGFLMAMVFLSSWATGLIQNGVFAHVVSFGQREYTQAIMTGQAVAGVLPCVIQIASVLGQSPAQDDQAASSALPVTEAPPSASGLFGATTGVFVVSLLAFLLLLQRQRTRLKAQPRLESSPRLSPSATRSSEDSVSSSADPSSQRATESSLPRHQRQPIGLIRLYRTLPLLSTAVFLCFAITMVFPVFTAATPSLHPQSLPPTLFIPLAFLIWNCGDLTGRLLTLLPSLSLTNHPRTLLLAALSRLIFIPLYLACNLHGHGALVASDTFYLTIQLLFGLSNGYLGSSCMLAAAESPHIAHHQKPAASAFMSLCIVIGLAAGSLLSFLVAATSL